MAKKEYKTTATYTFFNQRAVKKNAQLTAEAIEAAAVSVLAGYEYKKWLTVDKIVSSLEKSWDYDLNDYHFRRWWLDRLVLEWGYVIWNTVFDSHRKIVDDKKSEQIANDLFNKFSKSFS